jgi:hypothetical protein
MPPENLRKQQNDRPVYQSLGCFASTVNMAAAITIDGNT